VSLKRESGAAIAESEKKYYKDAVRNRLKKKLRAESGASVPKSELKAAMKKKGY